MDAPLTITGGGPEPGHEEEHHSAQGHHDHEALKTPLLEKAHLSSDWREESEAEHTWVYVMTFFAVMANVALGFGGSDNEKVDKEDRHELGTQQNDRVFVWNVLFRWPPVYATFFWHVAFLGYTSPTQEKMIADLDLTTAQFSTFGSLITVGCMVGAIISGTTADFFGRKGGLILCCIPSIGGFLLVTFGQSTTPLYIGRFAIGLAGGVVCYIVPTLVAETAPRHLRGFLGTMQQLSLSVGIMLVYLVGLFLPWRHLAAIGIIPSIVCVIGLSFVPESPYWLAKLERAKDLESSLQKLRGKDYDVTSELTDIQVAAEHARLQPASKLTDLFQKRYARPLLVGCGIHMFQQITGINGVMLYSGAIFLAAGVASANAAALCIAVLQVGMCLTSAGLIERAGRRLLLLISTSGMTVSLFFVGWSFYLKEGQDKDTATPGMVVFVNVLCLASLLVYAASLSLGIGPIPWVLIGELFPSSVQANAGSIASLVNWSCAWGITLSFNFILQWSTAGTFWLFGGISFLAVIFIARFLPETRGKTLEQIEKSFH